MNFKKIEFEEETTTQRRVPGVSISKPKKQSIKVSVPIVPEQQPNTHQKLESAESVVPWISLRKR